MHAGLPDDFAARYFLTTAVTAAATHTARIATAMIFAIIVTISSIPFRQYFYTDLF